MRVYFIILAAMGLAACASKFLKYEKTEELKNMNEFDQMVRIEVTETPAPALAPSSPEPGSLLAPPLSPPILSSASSSSRQQGDKVIPSASAVGAPTPSETPAVVWKKGQAKKGQVKTDQAKTDQAKTDSKSVNKKDSKSAVATPTPVLRHEPELEGQAGFLGRRPIKDPFRVGEMVRHSVNYFNVKAGELDMAVKPFAMVNGRKSYHYHMAIRTSTVFSSFYSVDDYVTSMIDHETLVPSVYTLHVKESGQLREARLYLDPQKKTAAFWEKKVTNDNGPEEKKLNWEVPDYSQHVFSAAFYMRVFDWTVGSENAFRVADNGENLIFRGKAIRKEKIETDVGTFNAIVIKPEIELRGKFKPVGDIFMWLSDDDRKFILKIESKIKIGTLVSEIVELERGAE